MIEERNNFRNARAGKWSTWRLADQYHHGIGEPHYSMPAIRYEVDVSKSSLGFRMFTVVYEIPEENAWRILGWDALMHWY